MLKPFQSELEPWLLEWNGKVWAQSCRFPRARGIALPDGKELPIFWLQGVVVGCTCVQAAGESKSTSHSKPKPLTEPNKPSLKSCSLLEAEVWNDSATYWGVSYVLTAIELTKFQPILIKVTRITCCPQLMGEETDNCPLGQPVNPVPRKTPCHLTHSPCASHCWVSSHRMCQKIVMTIIIVRE